MPSVKNFSGINVGLKEANRNNEASAYITSHYNELVKDVLKFGIDPSLATDLVNDVWVSMVKSEMNGEGYDVNHSEDGSITVEKFVYGRLKGYSKNNKYHTGFSEVHKVGDSYTYTVAASSQGNDYSTMDKYQENYLNTPDIKSECDFSDIDLKASLLKNVEFCSMFSEEVGFNMMNLFRNIDFFMKKDSFKSSIFDQMRFLITKNEEFGEALKDTIMCYIKYPEYYESVLAVA